MIFISPTVVAVITVTNIALMVLNMFLIAYVARTCVDRLESLLSGCKMVIENKAIYHQESLIGKVMRVWAISVMLIMPRLYARKGLVDLDEVKKVPLKLKVILLFVYPTFFGLFGALVSMRSWLH